MGDEPCMSRLLLLKPELALRLVRQRALFAATAKFGGSIFFRLAIRHDGIG